MSADLEIRITFRGQGERELAFELDSPSGKLPYTHHPIAETLELKQSPQEYRDHLLRAIESLDRGERSDGSKLPEGGVLRELESLGRDLYRELFPVALQQAYWKHRENIRTLRIVSDEPWLPWELIKPYLDGEEDDFLCCAFDLTRWLSSETAAPAELGAIELGAARVAAIEATAPAGTAPALPHARQEVELLAELAGRHSWVESDVVLSATHADIERVLTLGGHGVLHFVGHGWFDEKAHDLAGFMLSDGRSFLPRDLNPAIEVRLRQDRPLVFFGACRSAREGFALTRLGGWASRWIVECGCGAFIGPQWAVRDRSSFELARTFYRQLEAGYSIGSAARAARLAVREYFPEATTWAAYVVYAEPDATLRLGLGPSPLRSPELRWRSGVSPEGALLQAEYRVVPFHGRETEMEQLRTWCADEETVQVRLYTGAGGMGKTRLALELCAELRKEGWQVGFLAPDARRSPEDVWKDLHTRAQKTLVIVDYAESRQAILVPLLRELYRLDAGRYRVLLLAREALAWWEQLKREGDGVGDLLSGHATRWFMLSPLGKSKADREASYQIAAEAFGRRLDKPFAGEVPEDLDEDFYQRVLLIHMRALADVEGKDLRERDDILDYILRRERRGWERLAKARGVSESLLPGLLPAMAAINLGGGANDEEHAIAVLERLSTFADQPRSVLAELARLLHDSYPGEKWITPLLPDLLGEHLTRRGLQAHRAEIMGMFKKNG